VLVVVILVTVVLARRVFHKAVIASEEDSIHNSYRFLRSLGIKRFKLYGRPCLWRVVGADDWMQVVLLKPQLLVCNGLYLRSDLVFAVLT